MAKIPVEKKQQAPWIWWLLGLLLLGGIAWMLIEVFDDDEDLDVADVEDVEPIPPSARQELDEVDLGAILASPGEYVGELFPASEVTVVSVPTDRGFWIAEDSDSLFAIIIDDPEEQPKDINPGQTLQIEGGMLHDSSYLPEISGVPLDAETRSLAEEQAVFVVVDERNIVIREAGTPQPGTDTAETVQ